MICGQPCKFGWRDAAGPTMEARDSWSPLHPPGSHVSAQPTWAVGLCRSLTCALADGMSPSTKRAIIALSLAVPPIVPSYGHSGKPTSLLGVLFVDPNRYRQIHKIFAGKEATWSLTTVGAWLSGASCGQEQPSQPPLSHGLPLTNEPWLAIHISTALIPSGRRNHGPRPVERTHPELCLGKGPRLLGAKPRPRQTHRAGPLGMHGEWIVSWWSIDCSWWWNWML